MAWSTVAKGVSSWGVGVINAVIGYLLNEDGSFLLQENSRKIVLERDWDKDDKAGSGFSRTAKGATAQ